MGTTGDLHRPNQRQLHTAVNSVAMGAILREAATTHRKRLTWGELRVSSLDKISLGDLLVSSLGKENTRPGRRRQGTA